MLLNAELAKPIATKRAEFFLIYTSPMKNGVTLLTDDSYLANVDLFCTGLTYFTNNSLVYIMVIL